MPGWTAYRESGGTPKAAYPHRERTRHGRHRDRRLLRPPALLPGRVMTAALRNRAFAKLVGALAVSGAGDWLYHVALLALVWDRTHSTGWLTATTVARVAPMVLLGPIGGLLAQRMNRRRLLVVSDLVRLVTMVALSLVAFAGLPIWLAPVLAGLATAAAAP